MKVSVQVPTTFGIRTGVWISSQALAPAVSVLAIVPSSVSTDVGPPLQETVYELRMSATALTVPEFVIEAPRRM